MAKLKSKQLLKKKKTLEIVPVEEDVVLPSTRQSDEPAPKKVLCRFTK